MTKKVVKYKKGKPETVEVWIKRQVYGKAPEEHSFILKDGRKLKDLQELTNSLHQMHEDTFNHHANQFRNDFSTWINDVFNEKTLAEEIKKINSKMETELALHRHFESKLNKIIKELVKKK